MPRNMNESCSTRSLSVLPPDGRGWQVVEIEAFPKTVIFRVKMRVSNDSFKNIELVSQGSPLRVYINPDLDQPDEWEVPAGSGHKIAILSPS